MKIKIGTFENAQELSRLACNMKSDVILNVDRYSVDAKSILGICTIDLSREIDLQIIEKEPGEEQSLIDNLKLVGIALN